MIITGSEKAFAAGADIGAMAKYSFADVYKGDYITRNWETIRSIRKPVIAAVSGFALGGGCELAMMCDFIIAADNAKFGQPEIKLGVIPGAGGTQRLPRAVGKAKAMDMALTGRMMDATEAERAGLVSRVVPLDKLMDEALGAALMISDFSQIAVMAAKESVNRAFERHAERRRDVRAPPVPRAVCHADQKEGMDAFVNKRKANFSTSENGPPIHPKFGYNFGLRWYSSVG
jgi:enoyl-CoA hydratase